MTDIFVNSSPGLMRMKGHGKASEGAAQTKARQERQEVKQNDQKHGPQTEPH